MFSPPFFMAFHAFIDYLQYEKRYSAHTVTAYRTDLRQFFEFLEEQYDFRDVRDVSHIHIRSWVVLLIEKGLSNHSINRKISCLKAFYKYQKRVGILDVNPMSKVIAPKAGSRLPVFVEEKNMEALFSPEWFAASFEGRRDFLIIELFYNTGMRLSELIGLRESAVDIRQKQLKVLGKRNKERIVPMNETLVAIMEEYLALKKEQTFSNSCNRLIVKADGGSLYEKLVYRIVNHYLGKVTTLTKKSPHILRHTFATHMLNKGADLGAIKEILGHSSLAATQLYTHNSIEKLKEVHRKAHPKG